MTTRSAKPRFPSDHPAKVQNVDAPELPPYDATILEFSEVGLRLRTRLAMARGTQVRVNWEHGVVSGEIRYCRRTGRSTFHLGVTITQSSPKIQPAQG